MSRQNIRRELRPYIDALWQTHSAGSPATHVRAMPTGAMHIVFRPADSPSIQIYESEYDQQGFDGGLAVVNGFRSKYYIRATPSEFHSVGVMLKPEAVSRLFRCDADELAHRHTRLGDLWSGVDLVLERLSESSPENRTEVLQQILVERLSRSDEPHPAVQFGIEEIMRGGKPIGEVVSQTGYSHRRFNELFRRAVGVNPKTFTSVQRFQRLLSILSDSSDSLSAVAFRAGYSDQPHMTREFRRFAGISPGDYRRRNRKDAFTISEKRSP